MKKLFLLILLILAFLLGHSLGNREIISPLPRNLTLPPLGTYNPPSPHEDKLPCSSSIDSGCENYQPSKK